ncbi:MAG: FxsA family protein [Solirubrobacteraceae bacterium]
MLLLALIAWPLLEVFVFVEVGLAIGWLGAVVLLLGVSLLGTQLLRVQGRAAVERVSAAVTERRTPGRAGLEGVLGFLGGVLLVLPGFITDALGALLLLPPSRRLVGRWISRRYVERMMGFAATAARFTPGARGAARPADVDSTAIEEDQDLLGR